MSRYMLNDYIAGEKETVTIDNKTYELQQFKGDHSNEYLLSEIKDGKVEGECRLFNRGILSLAWTVKDGKRVGRIIEYDQGKVKRAETWESIMDEEKRRIVNNDMTTVLMTITMINKMKNEEIVVYRGGFDNQLNRDGHGIEYDSKNGKELIEGYWEHDKLISIIREFDAAQNIMIEYAEGDNIKPWNRVPLYIGGYYIIDNAIKRHGTGHLINIRSGAAICEVQYDKGEVTKEINLCDGWYKSILNMNAQFLTNSANNTQDTALTVVNNIVQTITSSTLFDALTRNVTKMIVSDNSCNDMTQFKLSDYTELESITIGNDCFIKVNAFQIQNLKKLKTLSIGDNSFSSKECYSHTRYKIYIDSSKANKPKTFEIVDCESLKSISIGNNSFTDFAGGFKMNNLPSLQSLIIGSIYSNSYNFICCSFAIRGTKGFAHNGILMI